MFETGSVKSTTKFRCTTATTLARGLLSRAPSFRDCLPQTLDSLVALGRVHEYDKGGCVVRNGDPFDNLGLLIKGSLDVSYTGFGGRRHLLGLLQPGEVVGLAPLFDGLPHPNDLWARAPSSLLIVPGNEVRSLQLLDPSLVRAFERQIAFRWRLLFERLKTDSSTPLDARIASLLQTMNAQYGLPRGRGAELDMKLSQTDMADMLGVSRQRINFGLKLLEADGLIRLRYSGVTLLNLEQLANRAQRVRGA